MEKKLGKYFIIGGIFLTLAIFLVSSIFIRITPLFYIAPVLLIILGGLSYTKLGLIQNVRNEIKSKLAITSFILGVLSLSPIIALMFPPKDLLVALMAIILISFFAIPLALIFGIISIVIIIKNKIGGILFGVIGILLSIIGAILLMIILNGIGSALTSFL
jgi:hypothetical protein